MLRYTIVLFQSTPTPCMLWVDYDTSFRSLMLQLDFQMLLTTALKHSPKQYHRLPIFVQFCLLTLVVKMHWHSMVILYYKTNLRHCQSHPRIFTIKTKTKKELRHEAVLWASDTHTCHICRKHLPFPNGYCMKWRYFLGSCARTRGYKFNWELLFNNKALFYMYVFLQLWTGKHLWLIINCFNAFTAACDAPSHPAFMTSTRTRTECDSFPEQKLSSEAFSAHCQGFPGNSA